MEKGAPLTEPEPINDSYIDGLAAIEVHGPCVRLTFCVLDTLFDAGHARICKVRLKVMVPRDALVAIHEEVSAFLAHTSPTVAHAVEHAH